MRQLSNTMTKVERAFYFADAAHGNQKYGNYTYMFHLWGVVKVAQDAELSEEIQVICMLHDVLEDTPVSYNDVKKEFGQIVADVVYAVTDELGKNRKERHDRTYPKIRENSAARKVKLCDRIANVSYSKLHDNHMFKMYRKENDEFVNSIASVMVYDAQVSYLIHQLGKLFK